MKRVVVGALVALLVAMAALFAYLDGILSAGIERGASYALGVDTRVGFARLSLLGGEIFLSRLRVANPRGFDEAHFLSNRRTRMRVDVGTLREPTVHLPLIAIDGVDVNLEREGQQTNYGTILANLKRFKQQGGAPAEGGEGEGKRFIVERLVITDVDALLEWSGVAADQTGMRVHIPEIVMKDIGAKNGEGVTMGQLSSIVLSAILGSIAKYGTNLPAAVLGQLGSGLGGLAAVPFEVTRGVGGKAAEQAGEVGAGLGKAVKGVGGGAVEGAGKALKGLGGMLGGKGEGE